MGRKPTEISDADMAAGILGGLAGAYASGIALSGAIVFAGAPKNMDVITAGELIMGSSLASFVGSVIIHHQLDHWRNQRASGEQD